MVYKFLEHTADIGIEVVAQNLNGAFIEAIYGLLDLIFNNSFKDMDTKNQLEIIEINSSDLESLLVDTLNEILFLIDSRKIIPLKPEIFEMSNNSLKLRYKKFEFDFANFPMHIYVKAVTYHQLEIIQKENSVRIKFFLDI